MRISWEIKSTISFLRWLSTNITRKKKRHRRIIFRLKETYQPIQYMDLNSNKSIENYTGGVLNTEENIWY